MSKQKLSWLGLIVEETIIEENLGAGSFSFIFKGAALTDGAATAFKLAKAGDLVERVSGSSPSATNALSFFTGGTRDVRPDCEELLIRQFQKVQQTNDEALVKVQKLSQQTGLCYYQMEYLPGGSLRSLIENGSADLETFANLALIFDRLSNNDRFVYHGDLKPENVMIGGKGLKLIDPGYFGPLKCQEGSMSKCAITTTCYYPSLTPDDLLAFGIMLWEASLGEHPLLPRLSSGTGSAEEAAGPTARPAEMMSSDALRQRVNRYSALGYFGFEPLLHLRRPASIKPGLDSSVEDLLLKALRLKINDQNQLDDAPGFKSFAEIHHQLGILQAREIKLS